MHLLVPNKAIEFAPYQLEGGVVLDHEGDLLPSELPQEFQASGVVRGVGLTKSEESAIFLPLAQLRVRGAEGDLRKRRSER